jgi:hypothetical protein
VIVDRERLEKALPGYIVGERLGSGASGLVLAAEHRRMGRPVAIKVMEAEDTDGVTGGFAAEARVLARLDHPHVLRAHDYVEAEGLCLVVMELLAGGTLTRRRVGMGPEQASAVGLAVAAALGHAHSHGVLHRDIKADNILFAADGTCKVSDFGIAKLFEGPAATTSRMAGTPMYMAPEQIQGGRLGPGTDLYSLAVVLYGLLAGRAPFDPYQPLQMLWNQHLTEPPPPMTGVAPSLAAVVLRALAKAPADRHPDAAAFALDLAHAAAEAFGPGWTVRADLPLHIDDAVRRAVDVPAPSPVAAVSAGVGAAVGVGVGAAAGVAAGAAAVSSSRPAAPPDWDFSSARPQPAPASVAPASPPTTAAGPAVGPSPSSVDRPGEPGAAKGKQRRRAARLASVCAVTVPVLAVAVGILAPDVLPGGGHAAGQDAGGSAAKAKSQVTVTATGSGTARPAATATTVGPQTPVPSVVTPTSVPSAVTPTRVPSAVTPRTAPTTAGPPSNPGQPQPAAAGPGSDPNYRPGSEVSVPGCAGWLDYSGILYGTLSAGAASCAAEVTITDKAYGAAPSTAGLKAANYTEANSKPAYFLYVGYYKYSARICIWNQNDAGGRQCSPTYVDTQGSITQG